MFKKTYIAFFILTLMLVSSSVFAQDGTCTDSPALCSVADETAAQSAPLAVHSDPDKVCIIYFYSPACPHCNNIKPYIESLENKYEKDIMITRYDVTDPASVALYNSFCKTKNYEGKAIPLIGINDRILVGEKEINDMLEQEIIRGIAMDEKLCPLESMQCSIDTNKNDRDPLIPEIGDELKWQAILPLVLFTGLADGINPCAFAVLIFIMAFLIEISSSKKRLLRITTSYISALLAVNILLGILYYYTSTQFGNPELIRSIAITLALAAGAINIKDYFYYGKGLTLKIPESSKTYIQSLTRKASVPSAVLLGSLVAILEAPCSIPIYLTVVEVLKSHGQSLLGIMPYILAYNIMFIVPLIILATAIYYGGHAKALEKWREGHKRGMKLMLGTILIILALAMVFGYI